MAAVIATINIYGATNISHLVVYFTLSLSFFDFNFGSAIGIIDTLLATVLEFCVCDMRFKNIMNEKSKEEEKKMLRINRSFSK